MDELELSRWWEKYRVRSFNHHRKVMNQGMTRDEHTLLLEIILPNVHNLDDIFPKYKIRFPSFQFPAYLDFVCIIGGQKIGFDIIKDYSVEEINIQIQNDRFLILNGWKVLRFSNLDFGVNTTKTATIVKQFFHRIYKGNTKLSMHEREIVTFLSRNRMNVFKPIQLYSNLGIGKHLIRRVLRNMVEQKLIIPVGDNASRTHRYLLNMSHHEIENIVAMLY